MKFYILFFIFFLGNLSNAQTKLIAFKSHSGSTDKFLKAVSLDHFDTNDSNFGVGPQRLIREAKLDTVIFINDHKSVIVTSNVCIEMISSDTTIWKPGKDTLVDNPVFNIKNIGTIKHVLKNDYYFKNNVDDVVFLEYNETKKAYKNITSKVKRKNDQTEKRIKKSEKSVPNQASFFGLVIVSGVVGYFGVRRKK